MTDENKNPNNEVKDKSQEALMARVKEMEDGLQVKLEEASKTIDELNAKVNKLSQSDNDDEIVDEERRSAHIMSLPVIDGSPIVKSEIARIIGVTGLEMMASVTLANGTELEIPFGCDVNKLDFSSKTLKGVHQTSYENLKTEKFELQNIDVNDLTGASKVEKNVPTSEGVLVAQIDRSSGSPIPTGKKIRSLSKEDIRHYTINPHGENITLTNKELNNIKI